VIIKKGLITDIHNFKQVEPGEHDSDCPMIAHLRAGREWRMASVRCNGCADNVITTLKNKSEPCCLPTA
jgi:hypothetical protein